MILDVYVKDGKSVHYSLEDQRKRMADVDPEVIFALIEIASMALDDKDCMKHIRPFFNNLDGSVEMELRQAAERIVV